MLYNMLKYYSILKKKKILQYTATWMNSEDIRLSEITSHRTKIEFFHLYDVFQTVKFMEARE